MSTPANISQGSLPPVPKLSRFKRLVRYALHLCVFYMGVLLLPGFLAFQIYGKLLAPVPGHASAVNALDFLSSHLLVVSFLPAFIVGLLINARFRHGVARWVWVVPFLILVLLFVFYTPGVYPTMLWDSDFSQALQIFFGGGLHLPEIRSFHDLINNSADWFKIYAQLHATMPAYAGVAYSLGAWLGMSERARKLQGLMAKL